MGAGKTILIGAIIATEFAMALEYIPGRRPLRRERAGVRSRQDDHRVAARAGRDPVRTPAAAAPATGPSPRSVKLTFTRDGEKDIPVIRGSPSTWSSPTPRRSASRSETVAQGRSRRRSSSRPSRRTKRARKSPTCASRLSRRLPHLAVFSDEAHHTYGQSLDTELKKVRKTVDYLAANTQPDRAS